MRTIVILVAACLTASACMPAAVPPPPPRAGAVPQPGQSRPAPLPPLKAAPATDPADTCGAGQLQYLVGRPKTEIPVPVNPRNRRVTCTSCPVTMDFSPQRLNIFFDQASGIVREVKCG